MVCACRSAFLILASVLAFPVGGFATTGGLRYTIGVESFENHSGWRGQIDLGDQLGVALTALLQQSDRFIVVGEKASRAAAGEEQDLAASGRGARGSGSPVAGHMAEAQLLIRGAITHVQHETAKDVGGIDFGRIKIGGGRERVEINVTFYLVDTTTGLVVASRNVVGKAAKRRVGVVVRRHDSETQAGTERGDNMMSALEGAAEEAIAWMASQLEGVPWQGSVIEVDGDRIVVNRGIREGVSPGLVFTVGKARVLRDPTTGEILGRSLDQVARIEVVDVQLKFSICRFQSGDPGRLRVGLDVTP
jgi:curli biogenesis system outer membrane secretion channel CsgG